jgi:hypothetical protein
MPAATPAPSPTLPPQPTLAQPAQPTVQSVQPTGQPGLFKFIQTIQITPDTRFLTGAFARINYVSATDRFVVTFGGRLAQPSGGCMDKVFSYKEYTTDMQKTGQAGVFSCAAADAGSVMVDNNYYFVAMHASSPTSIGWQITKYDAVNWKTLADVFLPLDLPRQTDNDPMVAYVNGQLDISAQYNASGAPPPKMTDGAATHHHFFSTDLQLLDEKILTDTPHITGSSLIYVDGIYYFITANGFLGDVVVMKYDKDWKYLGVKTLRPHSHWSTGVVYDGQKFYLAYLDTSQRIHPDGLPVFLNVHLAAFDCDWNLLDDVAVTSFAPSDNRQPGRPWLMLHNNRLYVSYDMDTIDPTTQQEQHRWQAYVSVYELPAQPGQPTVQPAGQASTCRQDQFSPLGVLRSSDYGATWTSLGNACLHDPTILAVDPTGFTIDGHVVLYFVDFGHLNQPVPQILYRAVSVDGVNFDRPQPAYTQIRTMVDPFVLRMPDGSFRMYVPSDQEGIISGVSRDGLVFTRENGARMMNGGMPGALLLPDNRVRIFLSGGNDGKEGIFSSISNDGINFTVERGVRIPAPANSITDNPQPIRLADGSYLMLLQIHDKKYEGLPPWEHTEIHLATSADGFDWTVNPTIIGYGGTSCVVEMPDGTLYIYYVNR